MAKTPTVAKLTNPTNDTPRISMNDFVPNEMHSITLPAVAAYSQIDRPTPRDDDGRSPCGVDILVAKQTEAPEHVAYHLG